MDRAHETPQATSAPQPQPVEATSQSIEVPRPDSGESNGGNGHETQSSSTRLLPHAPSDAAQLRTAENPYTNFERLPSPPPRSREGHDRRSSRLQNIPRASEIDWIVPVQEKIHDARRTVGERLQPTIDNAVIERDKYARKALWTGYALNIAIGLQVFLGALTTGLAAALATGRQAQVSTSILGGLSTLVASYMARARGSGEPELSITRVKDLEQFLRECRAFQLDHAHEYATRENGLSERLDNQRWKFEELLGNASGERKLSPVGITATQAQPAPASAPIASVV